MGKNLVNMQDLIAATNKHVISSADEIINHATKRTYFFNDMLAGKDQAQIVRGGKHITEFAQLTKDSQAQFYNPNDPLNRRDSDTLQELEFHWRYLANGYGWTEQQVKLNEGDKKAEYKRLAKAWRQNCSLTGLDKMEDAFISAAPVSADMEGSGSGSTLPVPYSLRAIVTEDGGPPDTADGASVVWTTVAGKNPDTYTNWANQVVSVAKESVTTLLRGGFGDMHRKLKWKAPRRGEDYFKETKFRKMRIITTGNGQSIYERICAEGNDSFAPRNDPGSTSDGPMWRGIPVDYVEAMDDIGYTDGQPRYFWLNLEHIFPVFHAGKYFEERDPVNLAAVSQPESWRVDVLNWYQIVFTSRRHHGVIRVA